MKKGRDPGRAWDRDRDWNPDRDPLRTVARNRTEAGTANRPIQQRETSRETPDDMVPA